MRAVPIRFAFSDEHSTVSGGKVVIVQLWDYGIMELWNYAIDSYRFHIFTISHSNYFTFSQSALLPNPGR